MPYLHPEEIERFAASLDGAEFQLDLRKLNREDALGKLENFLQTPGTGMSRVAIRIDEATAESGETLFHPVGRCLLDARRSGVISHLQPIGAVGFLIEFSQVKS